MFQKASQRIVLGVVFFGLNLLGLETIALRILPVEVHFTMPAGADSSMELEVINDESEVVFLSIAVCDWFRDFEGRDRFCDDADELERSASDWLTVSPTQLRLEPGAIDKIRYTMAAPSEDSRGIALDGSYWSAIMIETSLAAAETAKTEAGGLVTKRRIAVKIHTNITGTGELDGQVGNLRAHGLNPLWVSYEFENRGTLNIREVSGRIEIRDSTGETLKSINIEPFTILPGYSQTLHAESSNYDRLKPGTYVILPILDYGDDSRVGAQAILRVPELHLSPIGDAAAMPQDLDGDGFFEDVNGDFGFDSKDPSHLARHLEDPSVRENWAAFDYNNDGLLNFDDVILLQEIVDRTDPE